MVLIADCLRAAEIGSGSPICQFQPTQGRTARGRCRCWHTLWQPQGFWPQKNPLHGPAFANGEANLTAGLPIKRICSIKNRPKLSVSDCSPWAKRRHPPRQASLDRQTVSRAYAGKSSGAGSGAEGVVGLEGKCGPSCCHVQPRWRIVRCDMWRLPRGGLVNAPPS
jgi:hypothetical protein